VLRFFEDHGGRVGVLSLPLLESAVARPQTTVGGEDAYPSIASKAAALTHSLIMNHPFADANKRTGILSGLVFLRLNGYGVLPEMDELYQTALAVATHEMTFDRLVTWYGELIDWYQESLELQLDESNSAIADQLPELYEGYLSDD
jgi:death-on-curing protein